MKIDDYYWRAQYLPAILTSLPLMMVLDYFQAQTGWWRPSPETMAMMKVTSASVAAALSFLMTQVNAYLSKQLFQPEADNLPTTHLLLFKDEILGKRVKKELHQRIYTDFGIKLLSEHQESINQREARKVIASAVSRIRIRMASNAFVRRRLISYGFARNMVGGSLVAAAIALLMSLYQYQISGNQLAIAFSFILIYLLVTVFGRAIIRRSGNEYAETLFEQYLADSVSVKLDTNENP
jgi:hypothetical protein